MVIKKFITPQTLIIFFFTLVSRIIFAERFFFDSDTVSFALGSISYSLQDTRPHLPGYYLHVKLIGLLNSIIHDVHLTMILLSIAYSLTGALLAYKLLKKILSEEKAFLATILIITNPLVWYYNCTTDIYSFDLFFGALTVLTGLNKRTIYLLPVIFAIGTGIRPSTGILLFPLYIYFWYNLIKQREFNKFMILFYHLIGLIIFYTWFSPLINSAGGFKGYISLYKVNSPLPNISILQNLFQETSYLFYVLIAPVIILFIAFIREKLLKIPKTYYEKKNLYLILIWFLPAFFVFLFFHYSKGYFLICIIPLYAILFLLIRSDGLINKVSWILIVIQIIFYTLMPYKDSSIESIEAPQYRHQKIFSTWIDRTFSSYLMAASKIRNQDNSICGLNDLIMQYAQDTTKFIFFDPTVYLYARGMQMQNPKRIYITADLFNDNSYYEYKGINICARQGLTGVIKNSYFVTRKDYYKSYPGNLIPVIDKNSGFVIFRTDSLNSQIILNAYRKLFYRTNH